MSALTKVLIVLVLLLSAGFAVSQIVLYNKRENFALKYTEASDQLRDTRQQLLTTESETKDLTNQYDSTKATLENNVLKLTNDLATEKAEVQDLKARLDSETLSVQQLTEAVQGQSADLKAKDETIDGLKDTVADRNATIEGNVAKINDLDNTVAERDSKIGNLENQLLQVKTERQELAKSEERLQAIVGEFVRRTGLTVPAVQVPAIEARVIRVDIEGTVAVISKGAGAGVKAGTEFTIYNEGGYVAGLMIHDVDEEVSGGTVVRLGEGRQVQMGDNATTQIR